MKRARWFAVLVLCHVLSLAAFRTAEGDELDRRSSWRQPSVKEIKAEIDHWAADQKLDRVTLAKLDALWTRTAADDRRPLLQRVVASLALQNKDARRLLTLTRNGPQGKTLPAFPALADNKTSPWVRDNLRLYYGRWLLRHNYYREADQQLSGIETQHVADPAGLLFCQAVVRHHLLDKQNCLAVLNRLRENEENIPRRYAQLARLMEADIRPLRTDSLDEVARLMRRIENDLQLGRAGKQVQKLEEDVIAKLDKLIQDREGGDGPGPEDPPHPGPRPEDPPPRSPGPDGPRRPGPGGNPDQPMPDSGHANNRSQGDVDARRIGNEDDWGNLNPRQRQQVLQRIQGEMPAHYREVIEQYFRKLAQDGVR